MICLSLQVTEIMGLRHHIWQETLTKGQYLKEKIRTPLRLVNDDILIYVAVLCSFFIIF